jgi:hypothetical protein
MSSCCILDRHSKHPCAAAAWHHGAQLPPVSARNGMTHGVGQSVSATSDIPNEPNTEAHLGAPRRAAMPPPSSTAPPFSHRPTACRDMYMANLWHRWFAHRACPETGHRRVVVRTLPAAAGPSSQHRKLLLVGASPLGERDVVLVIQLARAGVSGALKSHERVAVTGGRAGASTGRAIAEAV